MTTLAIMQPYLFPYIGYWQLMHAADRFVIYDDVNYIKGGWINRNRILINGEPSYITMPLHQASPNRLICEINLQATTSWRDKILKTLEITYAKSPYFAEVLPVIQQIVSYESENLAAFLAHQLQVLARCMGIQTEIVITSRTYNNAALSGQARIIDICRLERAKNYINAQGGQSLYDTESFKNAGLGLHFITMQALPYKQRCADFVPYLSIIDALMEIGPNNIMRYLNAYSMLSNPATNPQTSVVKT